MFEKVILHNLTLRNRFVRSATNEHLGSIEGLITEDYIKTYEELAKNEVGLIITSHMAVNETQRVDETQICINNHNNFNRLKSLSETVHNEGGKIVIQLSQGGQKASQIKTQTALSSCDRLNAVSMNQSDIECCIKNFVQAVVIAKETGFDGVEFHLAHGYLLCEFLDPFLNGRKDLYGGTLYNRYKIVHRIITQCRELSGDDFFLCAKINITPYNLNPNFFEEQLQICHLLKKDGINAIEISGVGFDQQQKKTPYFLNEAIKVKEQINIPIILVGGFRNIAQVRMALDSGIEYIAASRPFICEPNFVQVLKNGMSSKCTDCNHCYTMFREEYKRCIFHKNTNCQLINTFSTDNY